MTHVLVNGVARKLYHIPSSTAVVEKRRSSERLDSREGNHSLTEFLSKLYNESFLYGNRSTIKAREIEDVYSNIEGYGSSVESTDENTEKNNHFPGKKCVSLLNITSGIRNGSDDKSDSVSNKIYAVANQTPEEGSPENGSSSSNEDVHISSSLDNKSTPLYCQRNKRNWMLLMTRS
jgi:hypothetical protein